MKNMENKVFDTIKKNLFWIVLFAIGLICMWTTQREVPIMMDDEWYSTILTAETPLKSLKDIFDAQIWHYNNWGGRTVAHTIAQLIFLYLKEPIADALNVVMIVLLAWMLNAVMQEKRLAFVTLTIGFLHGLNANWKMSMYWQTGACNYLYTTILIMGFLWLYLRVLDQEEKGTVQDAGWLYVLAPVLGLLSGWTNENMGPAVWVLTVLVMFFYHKKYAKIPAWMMLGSAACAIGCALMILAPGNAVRSAEVVSNNYGVVWQIFLRMYGVCKGAWEFLFPVILLAAGAVFTNCAVLGNKINQKEALLLAGAILSWGAMILSPHYPDRAAFGTMCFLICVIISQAARIEEKIAKAERSKWYSLMLPGIGVFVWLRGMYYLGEFLSICWGWIR